MVLFHWCYLLQFIAICAQSLLLLNWTLASSIVFASMFFAAFVLFGYCRWERKRNRGRRLENDQITHIQIWNGKDKCQQNICACVCSRSVAKRGVYCFRWQRCQAAVAVDFIFPYFEKFKVANWVFNQCININKYIYIYINIYAHTYINIYMYEFQSVALSKQCNSWQCCPASAVLPYLYYFFFLFFLLVATLSRTKKEITKKILSSCALYTCMHIQYIHK